MSPIGASVVALWLLASPLLAMATEEEPVVEPDPTAAILDVLDQRIQAAMDDWPQVPGHAVALVGEHGPIWSRGYGLADRASGRRMTADTPFLLASVSKTMIALALLSEVEAGRLRLDQAIGPLLPFTIDEPAGQGDQMELWHLATHTSGILDHPEYYETNNYDFAGDSITALGDWLNAYLSREGALYDAALNFSGQAPGAEYAYSNIGAALAAFIAERSSGQDYRELMQQRFFSPLGMNNTAYRIADFEPNQLAVPYFWNEQDETVAARPHYGGATYPDGWLKSSVNDMAQVVALMINRGQHGNQSLLQSESIDAIERQWFDTTHTEDETQALFWNLKFDGRAMVHSGYDYGTSTFVFYFPDRAMGGVVLTNTDGRGSGAMRGLSLQALTQAISALTQLNDEVSD
ncbi:MAG: serine hydrolase [Pseudomonadota bacterium]